MAGNPTITLRIDRQSKLALQAICEVDATDAASFASEALQAAISLRLKRLGKAISFGVSVPDEPTAQEMDAQALANARFCGCSD